MAELKLLVGSDLHNSEQGLDWFIACAQQHQPEVICFLGDFITEEPLSFTKDVLLEMRDLAPHVFVIPGNWDPRQTLIEIDLLSIDGLRNLHKHSAMAGSYTFAGLGGSTTTPLGTTPMESPPEGFATGFAPLLPADIWVLHNPVFGFRDKIANGANVGSEELALQWREQEPRPILVLSGHIHEQTGHETMQGTTFLNPGSLKEMRAALVSLTDRQSTVELLTG